MGHNQKDLCHPPSCTMAQELRTRASNTRRWHEAAIRQICRLSASLSQQLWYEGFSPRLGQAM